MDYIYWYLWWLKRKTFSEVGLWILREGGPLHNGMVQPRTRYIHPCQSYSSISWFPSSVHLLLQGGKTPHFQVPFSLVFGGVLAADGEASAGWSPEPPCKTPEKIKSRNERSILPRNHYNPWWKPCKTKTRLGWYVFLWPPLTPSATKLKDPPQQQGSFKAESMPRRWNEWKIESSTGRKWKRKKSWLLAFSHEKKTDQTWFSNWLFQRKADQIWWYWPKETTLIEKSEFHEDGIFAYIYHKDQPKCRSTYLYIYIHHTWNIYPCFLILIVNE